MRGGGGRERSREEGRGIGRIPLGRRIREGRRGECREIGRLRTYCDLYVLTVISTYLL